MAQAKDTETLYVEIPPSLKYLVDDDDRTNKELVIAALEKELGVSSEDSVAVIDRQVRRLEDEFEEERHAVRRRKDRLQEIKDKLERAREVREQKLETEASYEEALDDVLDDMEDENPPNLEATHPRLDGLREKYEMSNEEIHFDLQQRAAEQERPLTVANFKSFNDATPEDRRTPVADAWPADQDGGEE